MDILQALLICGILVFPLAAVGAIGAVSFGASRSARLGPWLAQLGAAASTLCSVGVLVRRLFVGASIDSPATLGTWFLNGPRDLLRIDFGLRLTAAHAGLTAVVSLAACGVFAIARSDDREGADQRWLYLGGSALLFAALGVVASTNLAELFVFWEIGTVAAYLMSAVSAHSAAQIYASRKFVLVQCVADALLMAAVFFVAAGFGTVDFRVLFDRPELWAKAAAHRAGLVDLISLCVLGAAIGRCGLVPLLGWIGDLSDRPAPFAALVQATAFVPCGALLLIRCFPLLTSATAIAPLAAFVGGTSVFCAAVCAEALPDLRRGAGFACASVMGLILLGLSSGAPASPQVALGMLTVFVPTASLILVSAETRERLASLPSLVAIVVLFSGICGQAWLFGEAVAPVISGRAGGGIAFLLTIVLAGLGQYLAARGVVRLLRRDDESLASALPLRSRWPLVLAVTGLAAGVITVTLNLRVHTDLSAGILLLATGVGCVAGIDGLIAGWRSWRRPLGESPDGARAGVLARLGRNNFYFDPLLFLCVLLPVRGIAAFARFLDWSMVDTMASGGPAAVFESAASLFAPIQHRSTVFYLLSAVLGAAVLSGLMVWLQV